MSTEEDSQKTGAKEISPDVLAAAQKVADKARVDWLGDGLPPASENKAEVDTVRGAALAYIQQQQAAPKDESTPAAPEESKDEFISAVNVRDWASRLLQEIQSLPAEQQSKLADEALTLQAALTSGILKSRMANIGAAIQTAKSEVESAKAETPEAKVERLREEIRKIDEDLETRYKKMVEQGLLTQEEFDRWKKATAYAAAHPEDRKAQVEAQKVTDATNKSAADRAKTSEEKKLVEDATELGDERKKKVEETAKALEKIQTTSQNYGHQRYNIGSSTDAEYANKKLEELRTSDDMLLEKSAKYYEALAKDSATAKDTFKPEAKTTFEVAEVEEMPVGSSLQTGKGPSPQGVNKRT